MKCALYVNWIEARCCALQCFTSKILHCYKHRNRPLLLCAANCINYWRWQFATAKLHFAFVVKKTVESLLHVTEEVIVLSTVYALANA